MIINLKILKHNNQDKLYRDKIHLDMFKKLLLLLLSQKNSQLQFLKIQFICVLLGEHYKEMKNKC